MLAVATPVIGEGQSPRTTRNNVNAWFTLNGEVHLTTRWFIDYDASLRTSGPVDELQQILPRVSARFQALPNLRFNWGYAFAETFPYGKLPAAFQFPEHRMWEQVQTSHAIARAAVTHRYRLEQRWQGRVALEDGEERVQNWVRTNRFRYRLQGTLPLQGPTTEPGEFYAVSSAEVMLNWGANVQSNVFDQHRFIFALGRRLSPGVRIEAGYMDHLIQRSNGRLLERNHTLMLTLHTAQSLVR